MTKKIAPYSVLMSVYEKENPLFLRESIDSMLEQTIPFDEFVIVEDGQLPNALKKVIDDSVKTDKRFKVLQLKKNAGLGVALSEGLKKCKNEYVVRMDSDDISIPERVEKQIDFLEKNPNIDACGSNIYEFKNRPNDPDTRIKRMPIGKEIERYIRKRNPINHMTVCFRKTKIENAGSYEDMPLMEDYWLWIRLVASGGRIDNLDQPLVYARIGDGFEKRRGNKARLKSWKRIQEYMLEKKMITKKEATKNNLLMWGMVHMPNTARKAAYKIIRR